MTIGMITRTNHRDVTTNTIRFALILAFFCVGLIACDDQDEALCNTTLTFGLVVVVDSPDGTGACNADVDVVVLENDVVVEKLTIGGVNDGMTECSYWGGTYITGTYDVRVAAVGYQTQVINDVNIPPGSPNCPFLKTGTTVVKVTLMPLVGELFPKSVQIVQAASLRSW